MFLFTFSAIHVKKDIEIVSIFWHLVLIDDQFGGWKFNGSVIHVFYPLNGLPY